MGVEYRRYLIPRQNSYLPSPEVVGHLITALRYERWIINPGSSSIRNMRSPYRYSFPSEGFFIKSINGIEPGITNLKEVIELHKKYGIKLSWPVTSFSISGLNYPLEPAPFPDFCNSDNCCYDFEFHISDDYIYHTSELIEPFDPAPKCSCGKLLEYFPENNEYGYKNDNDPFLEMRLYKKCPDCDTLFDPVKHSCNFRNSDINKQMILQGGAAYRFAVVVDCHKAWIESSKFEPGLKQLIEKITGIEMYEVPDYY